MSQSFLSVQEIMAIMVNILLWVGLLFALLYSRKQRWGDPHRLIPELCESRLSKEFGQWEGIVLVHNITRI